MSSGLGGEDHDDKLVWRVFKDSKQTDHPKLNMKLQPKYPTTRLLPEGYEETKTLALSKQIYSMGSSGPQGLKVKQRPRSDQVTYSHRSVSK